MRVKLEELVEEVSERTTINNQHPVLTSSRSGIYLQEDYFKKQVASKDNTGYRVIRKGEFTYRAMSDTGEFYPNKLECTDIGIVSPAYPVFKIKDYRILPDYLKYYFKSRSFQKSITAFVQGSTRASMKFGKMKSISIDLPDEDKQNQILNTIGILENIIDKYELEIDHLNNLIKARFVEMFENDNMNEKTIEDVASFCSRGKSPKYVTKSKLKVINQACIYWDRFKFENVKYNEEDYDGDRIISNNDLLICSTGTGTLGRCNIFRAPDDSRYMADSHVTIIRLNGHILPEVFKAWFERPRTQEKLYSDCVSGSTNQIELSKEKLKNMNILVPPINLQKQFASFAKQVDKSKFVLSNELTMCDFYIRLIHNRVMHSRINLRVAQ